MENVTKSAGVLCHISSLPGKYGIGNLRDAAKFALTLVKNGVKYWQVLPLVQTGYGDSPYQSVSCISGNPYFIDLDELGRMGLLTRKELKDLREKYKGATAVDYGAIYEERYATLRLAFSRFAFDSDDFRAFVKKGMFEDYALFMTAKTVYGGTFHDWDEPLMRHTPEALETLRTEHHEEYLFWQFVQYLFRMQWEKLHSLCRSQIEIIGDLPLYVAYDSADVWAHPELFQLDEDLNPVKVAGVPPDYFSETGQLWGNPVYDWKAHEREKFAWWTQRLQAALDTYDLVRIDHFRGIDRYYEIDADAENAIGGRWADGPKEKLFGGISREARSRIIAENLGIVDDGVQALLKKTGFPGMKVLLFAFDGNPDNEFLPKNIHENSVCYTGTHDNDTVKGYVDSLAAEDFILLRARLAMALEESGVEIRLMKNGENFPDAFVRLALASRAKLAIVPIQDILGLGNEARMNLPGTQGGNWLYRLDRPIGRSMAKYKKMIKNYRR